MDASEYDLQITNAYSSSNHHITCVYIYIEARQFKCAARTIASGFIILRFDIHINF